MKIYILTLLYCFNMAQPSYAEPVADSSLRSPFATRVQITPAISKPKKIDGGDYDDKEQHINMAVTFKNTDVKQTYDGYATSLYLIGQSAIDGKTRKVLQLESTTLLLIPGQSYTHECKELMTMYDKTVSSFGFYYDGWVIVVKDPLGKVALTKSSFPSWEKMPDKVSALQSEKCYNAKLEPVKEPKRR